MRIDPTMTQKEETYQVVLDIIKNTTFYKAFLATADVPEIYMQQFWHTVTKIKESTFYVFKLANKKCQFDVEVFLKDDGVLSRMKFVRIGEDFQKYGRTIPKTMLTERIKQTEAYQTFIKYSTSLIPPKKSRGKGSQGKKSAVTPKPTSVEVFDESDPKPLEGQTCIDRKSKKKSQSLQMTTSSLNQMSCGNLTPNLLKDQLEEDHQGIQTLTVEEQLAADTIQALKASRKSSKIQPHVGGSSEGTGASPGVPDESTVILTTSSEGTGTKPGVPDEVKGASKAKAEYTLDWGSEEESEYSEEETVDEEIEWLTTDEEEEKKDDDEDDISIDIVKTDDDEETDDEFVHSDEYVHDNVDEEMKDTKDTETGKDDDDITDVEKTDAEKTKVTNGDLEQAGKLPLTSSSLSVNSCNNSSTSSLYLHYLTCTTTNNTTVSPATTTVPDPLPGIAKRVSVLERDVQELKQVDHSAKILASIRSQKEVLEIRRIKKEHAEKQQMPQHLIKSSDKAALDEYDQKDALFQTMSESKSFNKHPAHKALYHALMESLLADEECMDQGVVDSLKQNKRQHDDQDEDPLAGPNQGTKTKRRRTGESESSKKSSTSKDTSKGNSPPKTSKFDKSVHAKETVVEPTKEVTIDAATKDVVNDADQLQDDLEPKTDNAPKHDWFKQPPRPPTPDLEWNKYQVVDDQPEQPWFNHMLSAANDPLTFDELMATLIDFSNFAKNHLKLDKITKADLVGPVYNLLKGTCQGSFELEYNMEECFKASNDIIDWENPKCDRCPFDLSKPLPLKGHPGHLTVAAEYFLNNDMEYLKSTDSEKKYTASITKKKAIRSQLNRFLKHEGFSHQKILSVVSMKVNKLNGYSYLEEIAVMLLLVVQHKLFHLDGEVIVDLAMLKRRILRNLERLVGARELEMDYRLMQRIV
ncbi:hypothetical protein Tco_1174356 [Tanacetum coccineum]